MSDSSPPRGFASRRRIAIAVGALLALFAAIRLALPFAVREAVERGAGRAGVVARVADVDLGLVRGEAALEGLALWLPEAAAAGGDATKGGAPPEPDPERALFRVERAYARLAPLDLVRGLIHVREIALAAPSLRLERGSDGRIELPVPPPPPEEVPPSKEAPGEAGWPIRLDRLAMEGASVRLVDAGGGEQAAFRLAGFEVVEVVREGDVLRVGDISLRGPHFSARRDLDLTNAFPPSEEARAETPSRTPTPAHRLERAGIESGSFALRVGESAVEGEYELHARELDLGTGDPFPVEFDLRMGGGHLRAEGLADLAPPGFDGRIQWSDLPLPLIVLSTRPELGAWVQSCRASGDLRVHAAIGAGGGAGEIRAGGSLALRDFAAKSPDADEVALSWKALEVALEEAVVPLATPGAPPRVTLQSVILEQPVMRYAHPAPSLAALSGVEPAAGAPAPAAPPPAIAVARFELRDGRIEVEDRSVTPAVKAGASALQVRADGVALPALSARSLKLRATLPGRGTLTADGSLGSDAQNFSVDLQRLGLAPFSAYASRAAGVRVERGQLSIETRAVGKGGRHKVENQIRLHGLAVASDGSNRFSALVGMPLDVVLALLRDIHGDVSLSVPMSVDEGTAGVRLGPVIAGAVRRAVTGAATAPLRAVGALGGLAMGFAGGPSLEPLAAEPGAAILSESGETEARALAELCNDRPGVGLRLRGRAGPEDGAGLAERVLGERIAAGGDLPPLAEGEGGSLLARRRVRGALRDRARGTREALSDEDEALLRRYADATEVPAERYAELARERAEHARIALLDAGVGAERVEIAEPVAEPGAPAVVVELISAPSAEAATNPES